MASETMGKKDREKKKQKKKQDKAEKMLNRKENNNKGKSLEDMMMYLDENGNLSPTPPDPRKMREINPEFIQIGVPKKEELEAEDKTRTGIVRFFDITKGYGFIDDLVTKESIFVHKNQVKENIGEGNKVSFETEKTPKGLSAINVKRAI